MYSALLEHYATNSARTNHYILSFMMRLTNFTVSLARHMCDHKLATRYFSQGCLGAGGLGTAVADSRHRIRHLSFPSRAFNQPNTVYPCLPANMQTYMAGQRLVQEEKARGESGGTRRWSTQRRGRLGGYAVQRLHPGDLPENFGRPAQPKVSLEAPRALHSVSLLRSFT